jgi:hypothetical protein
MRRKFYNKPEPLPLIISDLHPIMRSSALKCHKEACERVRVTAPYSCSTSSFAQNGSRLSLRWFDINRNDHFVWRAFITIFFCTGELFKNVHNSVLPDTSLKWVNKAVIGTRSYIRTYIYTYIHPDISSHLFLSGTPNKTFLTFLISLMLATCHAHFIFLDLISSITPA